MIVQEIIDRLKTEAGPSFGLVGGAAQLAALNNSAPPATPAAYVFIAEEASAENDRLNGVLQRTEVDVSVVLVVQNVADDTGAAAMADIEALKQIARNALIGWQPPSAGDVVTHVGGQLVRARDGYVWWDMRFGTAFYVESI